MNALTPLVVVAGLDADGKPHGAQFPHDQVKLVTKAAKLMKLGIGLANTETALAVAKLLPRGRIYDSGRAFAPLIKHATFQQLQQVLTLERQEAEVEEPSATQSSFDPWEQLKVGSVVLYGGKYIDEGWWECVITKVSKDGDLITCVWRGAPKEKPVQCRRHELGIIGREAMLSLRKL